MPPEAVAKLLETMPELSVAPSALVGVVAVAQVAEAGGVTVELLSVEVREAGALVHWRARSERAIAMLVPQISISDDKSTAYRAHPAEGSGDERSWTGSLAVLPTLPLGTMLTIVFESFGADERIQMPGYIAAEPIAGPWRFAIDTSDIRKP